MYCEAFSDVWCMDEQIFASLHSLYAFIFYSDSVPLSGKHTHTHAIIHTLTLSRQIFVSQPLPCNNSVWCISNANHFVVSLLIHNKLTCWNLIQIQANPIEAEKSYCDKIEMEKKNNRHTRHVCTQKMCYIHQMEKLCCMANASSHEW